MAGVAHRLDLAPTFGQSPFAIIRGEQFERSLFYGGGQRLLSELLQEDVLPPDASGLVDLRLKMNGGTRISSLDEAIEETRALLTTLARASRKSARSKLPAIAAGPTLRISRGVMLPEAVLIIDAVAIRLDTDRPTLIVGEVKTYPDRGGHTDKEELAVARAQAGIYVHALDMAVDELGIGECVQVSRQGFLVLTRPGSNRPRVRAREDLEFQARRAKRGFELLEKAASDLPKDLWALPEEEPPSQLISAIISAKTTYGQACLSFCDLAPHCFQRALELGDPAVLGEDARRFLGSVSLIRAMELLDGSAPSTEVERDLVRRIEKSDRMALK